MNELIRACFAGIWIESHEHSMPSPNCRPCAVRKTGDWPFGISTAGFAARWRSTRCRSLRSACGGTSGFGRWGQRTRRRCWCCTNFHRFIGSAEIVQAISRAVNEGKQQRTFVVVLSPVVQLPVELEKLFIVVEHPFARP